jgi:diadenosine tetraphosphate (Ap4A) HIT family hydrolase
VADGLTRKPRTAGSKKRAPAFTDDSEDFRLGLFGERHKLILNKYCAVRPQMVLHTVNFEPQDDLLNVHDFNAAWLALKALGDQYMVIYNGGKDAGASLNHKHMQVVPRSGHSGLESLLQNPEDGAQGPYSSRVQCEVSPYSPSHSHARPGRCSVSFVRRSLTSET